MIQYAGRLRTAVDEAREQHPKSYELDRTVDKLFSEVNPRLSSSTVKTFTHIKNILQHDKKRGEQAKNCLLQSVITTVIGPSSNLREANRMNESVMMGMDGVGERSVMPGKNEFSSPDGQSRHSAIQELDDEENFSLDFGEDTEGIEVAETTTKDKVQEEFERAQSRFKALVRCCDDDIHSPEFFDLSYQK